MKLGEKNVGLEDRAIRLILAGALAYWVFGGKIEEPWIYLALIAIIALIATAVVGSCTLYSVLGVSTCGVKKK